MATEQFSAGAMSPWGSPSVGVDGAAGGVQLQRMVEGSERLRPAALVAVVQAHAGRVLCAPGLQLADGLKVCLRAGCVACALQQAAPAMPLFRV